ncbi:cation transporter, partial [Staphylococcus aureus]|uniref:cation transporter n=1 Tax=Staphylococcus aureus TaxID=1280 RepID=UPI0037D9F950
MIPFKISIKPPHPNHPYPHFNSQNISSLFLSFLIIFLPIQLLIQNPPPFFKQHHLLPNPITIILTLITPLLIFILFPLNQTLPKTTKTTSLNSPPKHNLSDTLLTIA